MKRVVLALLLISTAASGANKQLAAAFHAAFGKGDSVVLKKQGELKEDVKYTPGDLVDAPFGPVLLSPGEVLKSAHVNSGKLAVVYLRPSDKGYDVVKKFVRASLRGWKDALANPEAAADIQLQHVKALDRQIVIEEINILKRIGISADVQKNGFGHIDQARMKNTVDFINNNIEVPGEKLTAEQITATGYLPAQPILP